MTKNKYFLRYLCKDTLELKTETFTEIKVLTEAISHLQSFEGLKVEFQWTTDVTEMILEEYKNSKKK